MIFLNDLLEVSWVCEVIEWDIRFWLSESGVVFAAGYQTGVMPFPPFAAIARRKSSVTHELSSPGALLSSPRAEQQEPHAPFWSGPPLRS